LTPNGQTLTINQQPLLPEIPADIRVVPLSNLPKAIRLLDQTGANDEPAVEVDAILGPAPILEEAVKSELPVKLAPQAENLGLQPLVVAAVPRDDLQVDRLIQEINQALDRLERQGTLAEIHLRWYGQDLSQSHPQAAPLDDQGGQE
jgi:ABC-type amino acid transport substrate-binding protein